MSVLQYTLYYIIIIIVFCPRTGPSLQAQEPRLQFCRRTVFHHKLRNQAAVLSMMNRCGNFPLLSAPHSLFSIWIDLKRSETISGAPMWRWGEWIWLTGPSGLHRNSLQGLNISFPGFKVNYKKNVRKRRPHPSPDNTTIIIIKNHSLRAQWPLVLTCPKTPYITYYTLFIYWKTKIWCNKIKVKLIN